MHHGCFNLHLEVLFTRLDNLKRSVVVRQGLKCGPVYSGVLSLGARFVLLIGNNGVACVDLVFHAFSILSSI